MRFVLVSKRFRMKTDICLLGQRVSSQCVVLSCCPALNGAAALQWHIVGFVRVRGGSQPVAEGINAKPLQSTCRAAIRTGLF